MTETPLDQNSRPDHEIKISHKKQIKTNYETQLLNNPMLNNETRKKIN
jgi:hypothetical protein